MMSLGSHVPTSRVTACMRAPSGLAGTSGTSVGSSPPMRSSRTHASTPSSYAGYGFQPNSRPPSQPQPMPRTDQRAAVHRARRQVGAEVRTGRRSDMQGAVGVAPRHDLQSADRRAERPLANRVAGGERVPVAARPALRSDQRGVDDRGLGILVGGPLARPLLARKHFERRGFRPLRLQAAELAHRTDCLSRCASRRRAPDRPWTGTVCRTCPASP